MSLMENKKKILLNEPHLETIEQQGVRFNTDMRAPLKSCRVEFSPIQEGSGDPAPDNIRPIRGTFSVPIYHAHKSLVPFAKYESFIPHRDATSGRYYNGYGYWSSEVTYFNNLAGQKLTYSVYIDATSAEDDKSNCVRVWAKDPEGNYLFMGVYGNEIAQGCSGWSSITITIPNNMAYIAFGLGLSEYSAASYPRVELGDLSSMYHPGIAFLAASKEATAYVNGFSGWCNLIPISNLPKGQLTYSAYIDCTNVTTDKISRVKIWATTENDGPSRIISGTAISPGTAGFSSVNFDVAEGDVSVGFGLEIQPGCIASQPKVEFSRTYSGYEIKEQEDFTFPSIKNLLDVTRCSFSNTPISISNGTINVSKVLASNSTHMKFVQEFAPGTYTFSAQCSGEGFGGLSVLFSSALPGGEWNNSYQGYWKSTVGNSPVLTFTLLETSTLGIIVRTLADHANEPALIQNIQVEAGSSATTYEPYTDAATYCIMPTMKNLLDIKAYSSKANNLTISDDSLISDHVGEGNGSMIKFAQVFPAGTYTFSAKGAGEGFGGIRLLTSTEISDASWNDYYSAYWINLENNTLTFTLNERTTLGLVFRTRNDHAQDSARVFDIQLESGSTATSYEPYRTVYGGWIDLVTGVVCKTWNIVNLGDCTWERIANPYAEISSTYIFTAGIKAITGYKVKQLYNGLVTSYKWVSTYASMTTDKTAGTIYYTNIAIRDDSYTDADDFKAAMNGVYLAYELETPVYYQLTPDQLKTFKNTNTIWGNTNGNTIVQYWTH